MQSAQITKETSTGQLHRNLFLQVLSKFSKWKAPKVLLQTPQVSKTSRRINDKWTTATQDNWVCRTSVVAATILSFVPIINDMSSTAVHRTAQTQKKRKIPMAKKSSRTSIANQQAKRMKLRSRTVLIANSILKVSHQIKSLKNQTAGSAAPTNEASQQMARKMVVRVPQSLKVFHR